MNKEIIALIPIKGNKKSLKNGKIRKLGGKPFFFYVLDAAINSGIFNKIFVSTDSEVIKEFAENLGIEVILEPHKSHFEKEKDRLLCLNKKYNMDSYILYPLKKIEEKGINFNHIFLIQATSPLTKSDDIIKSLENYYKEDFDSMLSVCKFWGGFHCGSFLWDENKNSITYNYKERKRRQEYPPYFLENGAFWIFKKEGFYKYNNRLFGKKGFYVMPKKRSFEIDDREDYKFLEIIWSELLKKENSAFP